VPKELRTTTLRRLRHGGIMSLARVKMPVHGTPGFNESDESLIQWKTCNIHTVTLLI